MDINKLLEIEPAARPHFSTGCAQQLIEGTDAAAFYLTDARWALITSTLPGKRSDPGRSGRDNRLFVEAVLWIVRTGSAWRHLPPRFGHWYTAYTRFNRWSLKNVWLEMFRMLAQDQDCEYFYENGVIFYAPLRRARPCRPRSRKVATAAPKARRDREFSQTRPRSQQG